MKALVGPRRHKILLLGAVIAAVLLIVAARVMLQRADAAEKAKAAQAPPIPVVTATVAKEDVPILLTGIGTVQPAQSVTVKVRVDGQLEKVDRKSTRLNSSHPSISYAVFCLKK